MTDKGEEYISIRDFCAHIKLDPRTSLWHLAIPALGVLEQHKKLDDARIRALVLIEERCE